MIDEVVVCGVRRARELVEAGEIKQAINALVQLAQYYGVEKELAESVDASIERRKQALGLK